MGRLIHQHAAALAAPGGAPGAGAVVAVRPPPAVDDPAGTADLAQLTALHQGLHLLVQLVGALVEHDAEGHVGVPGGAFVHLPHSLGIHAGGLFHQHVHAMLQAVDGDLRVQVVGDGGDHRVAGARGDHVLPVPEEGVLRVLLTAQLLLGGVDVAQRTQGAVGRTLRRGHAGEALGLAAEEPGIGRALVADADQAESDLLLHGKPLLSLMHA